MSIKSAKSLASGLLLEDDLVSLQSSTKKTSKISSFLQRNRRKKCPAVSVETNEIPKKWDSFNRKLSMSTTSTLSNLTDLDSESDSDLAECEPKHPINESRGRSSKAVEPTFSPPDYNGQKHPVETVSLIQYKLFEFDQFVEKLPKNEKKELMEAETRCPELLSDDFKLMFLRTEVFNAKKAAVRFSKYWKQRVCCYGAERAFAPLTAASLTEDEIVQLKMGFMNIVERKNGRKYIFSCPSNIDPENYNRDSMLRAMHYVMLSVLRDEECSKKGLIILANPRNVHSNQVDPKLYRAILHNVFGIMPMRLSAYHCFQPSFLFKSVFNMIYPFVPKRLRERLHLHTGSDEKVHHELATKYYFTNDVLPVELGGEYKVNANAWLQQQMAAGM